MNSQFDFTIFQIFKSSNFQIDLSFPNFQISKSPNLQIALVLRSIIYFFIVGGLIEGFFIYSMLKSRKYSFAVGQSLLVNGLSLIVSLIAWPYIFPTGFDFADLDFGSYFLLWLAAVAGEIIFLKLFYRKETWMRVVLTNVVMNIVAYIILYLVFVYANR